ncbi:MAG: type VI secretion system membrane subunit TssM [Azoarcus sp.]|nr:MAG: type VI secretion system membrane subunit TssM [Azoarcus sp.]
MSRLRAPLTDARFLTLLGFVALAAFLVFATDMFGIPASWAIAAGIVFVSAWVLATFLHRRKARQHADALHEMLDQPVERQADTTAAARLEQETLRQRMQEAVTTIKRSKLGRASGRSALYELPWYVTIGNPAAGKSSAIINSGLQFPFEDGTGSVVKGIGGTRNCDWFFTTEGILLDTAGRYSVYEDDRQEWLYFLSQLRKHRPLAQINGIIITASIAELSSNPPEFAISLARSLRQRVQELTERLQVFAPAYVMFSKADLIAGFNDFFQDLDWNERDRVWGATLPCNRTGRDSAIDLFDRHFDILHEGLRELGVAQIARAQGERMPPGMLAFPLEFAAVKPALRVFIATLFEDNPYQFEPVFRGFYFTSALQNGEAQSLSDRKIETRFSLKGEGPLPERVGSRNGFFLRDLFSQVIFADRQLVRQYSGTRQARMRQVAIIGAIAALGVMFGGWSWSYSNNRSLVAGVTADLESAAAMQADNTGLQSRLAALELIQDRIAQLEDFDHDRPLSLGLGLYQGEALKAKLFDEYHAGIRSILLTPVREQLEAFLTEVSTFQDEPGQVAHDPTASPAPRGGGPYVSASPSSVEDAYKALKTYLMLADRAHLDAGHLSDHLTRIWREWLEANRGTMGREEMIRRAGKILSFHLAHTGKPEWPLIENNLALADQVRERLRKVVRGLPATERIYADIRTRASTRFPAVSIAGLTGAGKDSLLTGSHVVSGAFTHDAWKAYVRQAIDDAATGELQSTDWVLQSARHDDLTLQGSPAQIRNTLTTMYKQEYAAAWAQLLQGVSISSFDSFPMAVAAMDRLGDPQRSPIGQLMRTVHAQTAWDNPPAAGAGQGQTQAARGLGEWFRRTILRTPVASDATDALAPPAGMPLSRGELGEAFAGVDRLLAPRDDGGSLLERYLLQLSQLRSRLNQIANQGDPGPGSIKLIRDTLDDGDSELAATLRFVDEQMLAGMEDAQRAVLRPLLIRPLLQTFDASARPAEDELNRIWLAQVHEPFTRRLALKYPFSAEADIEATPAEIAQIFGPEGAIAHYFDGAMAALVVRRGNTVAPRTWGDLGIRLQPDLVAGFPRWVTALEGAAASSTDNAPQTTFMLMPHPVSGTTGYLIEIDGQRLQYRNGAAQWATFIWPNPDANPGARIVVTRFDGSTVEVAAFAGRFGLEKLINSAQRIRKPDGSFTLSWGADELQLSVGLRIISSAQAHAGNGATPREGLGEHLPQRVAGLNPAAAPEPPSTDRAAVARVVLK